MLRPMRELRASYSSRLPVAALSWRPRERKESQASAKRGQDSDGGRRHSLQGYCKGKRKRMNEKERDKGEGEEEERKCQAQSRERCGRVEKDEDNEDE